MFEGCAALTSIPELDTANVTSMDDMFKGCSALENLNIVNWTQQNIDLSYSSKLTSLSTHNIISQAIGSETRTLILHADAYAAWQASEYYSADNTDATSKNITVEQAS